MKRPVIQIVDGELAAMAAHQAGRRAIYPGPQFFEQSRHAARLMAEYYRRLNEAGFVFGPGPMWDCFEAGPGVDLGLAVSIWLELSAEKPQ